MSFDIGQIRRGINTHKPMERAYALRAFDIARDALDSADRIFDESPLQATRARLRSELEILKSVVLTTASDPIDEVLADRIRDKLTQSFIELNAAAEGAGTAEANSLWDSTAQAISDLPSTLGEAAGQVVGGVADAAGQLGGGLISGLFKSVGGVLVVGGIAYLIARRMKWL